MLDCLKELTALNAVSGDEGAVREYILRRIEGFCETTVDPLGNILAWKKGKQRAQKKIMLDAHMDEVGLIISSVTEDGFLKCKTVGGIDTSVLMFRQVKIGEINGVIGGKPIHLLGEGERKKLPDPDCLTIDIGAASKEEALRMVHLGDRAVITGEFCRMGDVIKAKAIDDRVGCAILISLLQEEAEYDFCAVFSVQEEIGLRGARTAAYTVDPQAALVLEATTAADIAGVSEENRVCRLGQGPAVSFMDRSTLYDRAYYEAALASGIPCQPKAAVAGGNNAGAVHLSRGGVRTLAISVPCRYLHSPSCMAHVQDMENAKKLARYLLEGIASGRIV